MRVMITLSLMLNIIVLAPVCAGLRRPDCQRKLGPKSLWRCYRGARHPALGVPGDRPCLGAPSLSS